MSEAKKRIEYSAAIKAKVGLEPGREAVDVSKELPSGIHQGQALVSATKRPNVYEQSFT